jgi:hypothetical protein
MQRAAGLPCVFNFSAVSVTSAVTDLEKVRDRVTQSPARGDACVTQGERAFGEGTEHDTFATANGAAGMRAT